MNWRKALVAIVLLGAIIVGVIARGDDSPTGTIEAKTVFEGSSLPSGLPADFPFPDDVETIYVSPHGDGGTSLGFFRSKRSTTQLYELFRKSMPRAGWRLSQCSRAQRNKADIIALIAKREDYTATIAIGNIQGVHPQVKEPYSFYVYMTPIEGLIPQAPESGCTPNSPSRVATEPDRTEEEIPPTTTPGTARSSEHGGGGSG